MLSSLLAEHKVRTFLEFSLIAKSAESQEEQGQYRE